MGSSPLCDIHIDGPKFTAIIFESKQRLHIQSLTSKDDIDNRITIDNIPIVSNPVPLRPGSAINIGLQSMKIRMSKELRFVKTTNEMPVAKRLKFSPLGENTGHTDFLIPREGQTAFVGRSPKRAGICIKGDGSISRKHAQVVSYNKTILLLDCYSKNGTFVNEERISKKTIHPGDIISFGSCDFILCFT
jgi:hypothetical protein